MDLSRNAHNYFNGTFNFGGNMAAQSTYNGRPTQQALPPQSSFTQAPASQYTPCACYQPYQQHVPTVQQPFAAGASQYTPQSQTPVHPGMKHGYPHPQMSFNQGIQKSHLSAGATKPEDQQGQIYGLQQSVHLEAPLCFCDAWGHPCDPSSIFYCPGSRRAYYTAVRAAAATPQRPRRTVHVNFGELLRSDALVVTASPKEKVVVDKDIFTRAGPPAHVDLTGLEPDNSAAAGSPDGPIDLATEKADDVEIVGADVTRTEPIDLTNEDTGKDQIAEIVVRQPSQPPQQQNQDAVAPAALAPAQFTPSEADKDFMKGYKKRYGKHLGFAARAQTAGFSQIGGFAAWTAGQVAYNAASQYLENNGASNRAPQKLRMDEEAKAHERASAAWLSAPEHLRKQVYEQIYETSLRNGADGPESGSATRLESRDPDVAMIDAPDSVVAAGDKEQAEEGSAGDQFRSTACGQDIPFDTGFLVNGAEYVANTKNEIQFDELTLNKNPETGVCISEAQPELVLAAVPEPQLARPAKRPRGRPKGSKNRTAEQKVAEAAEEKATASSKPNSKKRKLREENSAAEDVEEDVEKPQPKRSRKKVPAKVKKIPDAPVYENDTEHCRAMAQARKCAKGKAYRSGDFKAVMGTAELSLASSWEAFPVIEEEPVGGRPSDQVLEALWEKLVTEQDSAPTSASASSYSVIQPEKHAADSAAISGEDVTVSQPVFDDAFATFTEESFGDNDDINALFDSEIEESAFMMPVDEEEPEEQEDKIAQSWAEKKVAAKPALREDIEKTQLEEQNHLGTARLTGEERHAREQQAVVQAKAKAEAEAATKEDAEVVRLRQKISEWQVKVHAANTAFRQKKFAEVLARCEAKLETRIKELQAQAQAWV